VPSKTPKPAGGDVETSLTTAVLDRLRADILAGELLPGEKLRLEHLTERYGSGRTPLREACSRLAAEGLVLASEQRGFRVMPISRSDLLDLTVTRQRIESLALRDAIAHGEAAWEARVHAAWQHLQTVPRGGRSGLGPVWEDGHRELHAALLSACDSPWLLRFRTILYDQSERYRRLSVVVAGAPRDIDREHAELVRASLERDAERAVALLVEHLAKTKDLVLRGHPALTPDDGEPVRPSPLKMSTKSRKTPVA